VITNGRVERADLLVGGVHPGVRRRLKPESGSEPDFLTKGNAKF
jgi:hypothetical protein